MRDAGNVLAAARTAPVVDVATLTGGGPVLVLSPHPDDESLGCGGLIAACMEQGIGVEVALLTDGAGSHPGSHSYPEAALARLRATEMRAALGELGLAPSTLHELGWPDRAAPIAGADFAAAAAQVVALVRRSGARCIVAAWGFDPHCDHESGAAVAQAAARETGAQHLAYPVWGWTLDDATPVEAGPALRLDVGSLLAAKRRAVACHRSQYGELITDSPGAFSLPAILLEACLTSYEVFFQELAA